VIAFEPSVQSLPLLQKNITLNSLTNVTAFPVALSEKTGRVAFTMLDLVRVAILLDTTRLSRGVSKPSLLNRSTTFFRELLLRAWTSSKWMSRELKS